MALDLDLQSVSEARQLIKTAKQAQIIISEYSQEKIDAVVAHMAKRAEEHAKELAKMAQEETGFGRWQDKIIKNQFASRRVYEYIKDMKTVGIIKEDRANKIIDVAVPLGVITALIPSTNPTSTVIYKSLIAVKAGNAIVFSPHPGARKCSKRAIDIMADAAREAGAPEGLISGLSALTLEGTQELMKHKDTALILATGGEAMVRAAYRSGTPTVSGGPGNGPAFIERTADIKKAVSRIIDSKTFDNGVICASEQSIVTEDCIAAKVKQELLAQGAYFLSEEESKKLGSFLLRGNGTINPAVVGKTAEFLAEKAGISIPADIKVLISEQTTVGYDNPFSREKLCPVLAFYVENDWYSACERCMSLLTNEGKGHTLVIHTNDEKVAREFILKKPVFRILVNTPAALGGIGATTNLAPALTLGCGALGGGSSSDNISPLNLINIKKAGYGVRELSELKPNDDIRIKSFLEDERYINQVTPNYSGYQAESGAFDQFGTTSVKQETNSRFGTVQTQESNSRFGTAQAQELNSRFGTGQAQDSDSRFAAAAAHVSDNRFGDAANGGTDSRFAAVTNEGAGAQGMAVSCQAGADSRFLQGASNSSNPEASGCIRNDITEEKVANLLKQVYSQLAGGQG